MSEPASDGRSNLQRPTETAWAIAATGGLGKTLVLILLTVVLVIIFYSQGEAAAAGVLAFAHRLGGQSAERTVHLAGQAIRSVALGVVVTALIQSVLAGIGLWLCGIPYAGLLTAIAFILGVAQLGPFLVLAPAIGWLFWIGHPWSATALLVWSVPVGVLDNVIRPFFIRRGVQLPMLLIIAGVIGGLISFGMRKYLSLIPAAVLLLSGCQARPPAKAEAAAQPQFHVDATIKDIMDSIVDPGADYIWDAVATTVTAKGKEEKYPRTDDEWKEVRRHAIHLMEASNMLLIPGRHVAKPGEKGDPRVELPPEQIEALINQDRVNFTKLANGLYDSVLPVLRAIDKKDKEALLEAGDAIDQACENCHFTYWYPKR